MGFGTFTIAKRKARTGRNPQTGSPIQIPARRVVSVERETFPCLLAAGAVVMGHLDNSYWLDLTVMRSSVLSNRLTPGSV